MIDFETVLKTLIINMQKMMIKYYEEVKKYEILMYFWKLVGKNGYHFDENSLEQLMIRF